MKRRTPQPLAVARRAALLPPRRIRRFARTLAEQLTPRSILSVLQNPSAQTSFHRLLVCLPPIANRADGSVLTARRGMNVCQNRLLHACRVSVLACSDT